MAGNYNNEMMRVLSEAGVCNPQYGNYAAMMGITDTRDRLNWHHETRQHYNYSLHGVGAPFPVPQPEDRFNVIGYSWGAAVAARLALYYASQGVEIDFLGLVAAPINESLLTAVDANPLIKKVAVFNLSGQGDPIFAGMNDLQLASRAPQLLWQMLALGTEGHFYFSGSGTPESLARKRYLVAHLIGNGLR